jgi:hypothetical protein
MVAGLLKYERRPLQQIVDDLYAARGDLFDDLFSRAWALLDEAGKRTLMVMTFFPDSASSEALSATADVTGFDFDRATERLTDLSLLDVQQTDLVSTPRYVLHPLVRAFAGTQLAEQPDFEQAARGRWVGWYAHLACEVRNKEGDIELDGIEALDTEYEAMFVVVEWVYQNQLYRAAMQLAADIGYYYNVRGYWDKKREINLIHTNSAHFQGDDLEEARGLLFLINLLIRQGALEEVDQYLPRLLELEKSLDFSGFERFAFQSNIGEYALAQHDIDTAIAAWETVLSESLHISEGQRIQIQMWMAQCFYKQNNLSSAYETCLEALKDATQQKRKRSICFGQITLANIHFASQNYTAASECLNMALDILNQTQERPRLAAIYHLEAKIADQRGDTQTAHASLLEAIDLFERMGMRRELAEAREELARLEAQMADAAE